MSTRGSLCMLPALVLGLLLGAQTARAEDEDRDAFVKGTELYQKGEYAQAIEAFLRARAIHPRAKTDFNLGRAHHKLSQLPEAAARYELASRGTGPDDLRVAAKALARLNEILGQVARVRILCAERSAEVLVDGQARGRTPLETSVFLAPGPHRLVVRQPHSGAEFAYAESLAAGVQREVRVVWPASLAGRVTALSPLLDPPTELELRRRRVTRWAYGTLGAGIACALIAGVLWTVGGLQGNEAHDRYSAPGSNHDWAAEKSDIDAAATKMIAADVIAGIGAAALGASIYLFLTRPAAPETRAPSMPALQLGAGSLGLSGHF